MSGAKQVFDRLVFARICVPVPDQKGDRGPRRFPLKKSREDFRFIFLLPRRSVGASTRLAESQFPVDLLFGDLEAGWATVNDNANGRAMRFPKSRNPENLPKII